MRKTRKNNGFALYTLGGSKTDLRFLTNSETKLLTLMKQNPKEKFSLRGLSRRLEISACSVYRALRNLTETGLVKQTK